MISVKFVVVCKIDNKIKFEGIGNELKQMNINCKGYFDIRDNELKDGEGDYIKYIEEIQEYKNMNVIFKRSFETRLIIKSKSISLK